MWTFWLQVVPVAVLLVLGFFIGRWRERSHFHSLIRREADFRDLSIVNLKTVPHPEQVSQAKLVYGDAVIATDYFKGFAARLRSIVGGELRSYETLMERARREATLRLLQQARAIGATEVWNIR
ncbi:MAG: heavy metal-binding domain-containing protein, partial [Planctomycetes bacterium]|nr:heavy metal-binding domain-containing protein [Planctomycetota bacterium]